MSKEPTPRYEQGAAELNAAQEAQTAFWEALSALEDVTGLEIDGSIDLTNYTTVDELREGFQGNDDGNSDAGGIA